MTAETLMTRDEVQARAKSIAADIGAEIRLDEPLAPLVSMRVGGPAAALLVPRDSQVLAQAVVRLESERVPHVILGGGSNVLVADRGLDMVVVHAGAIPASATWDGSTVRAPGSTPLGHLVAEAARRGMSGLEWAAGLPGTVGGAVVGNAGAFGSDIAASVAEVVVMSHDGRVRTHAPAPGDFGYRRSFIGPDETVLQVALRLRPADVRAVRDETGRINKRRAASQPKGGHSSGCMFRNPAEAPAGRLIDECGLKGLRVGGAFVSPTHANFVINDGSATADDILALIKMIRAEVRRQKGIELELEVRVWPTPALVEEEQP